MKMPQARPFDRVASQSDGPYRARPRAGARRRVLVHRPAQVRTRLAIALLVVAPLFVLADFWGANVRVTLERDGRVIAWPSVRPLRDADAVRCRIEKVRMLFPTHRECDRPDTIQWVLQPAQGHPGEQEILLDQQHDTAPGTEIRELVPASVTSKDIWPLQTFWNDSTQKHLSVTLGSPWRRVPANLLAVALIFIIVAWWRRRTRIIVDDGRGIVRVEQVSSLLLRTVQSFAQAELRWVTIEGVDERHVRLTMDLVDGRRVVLPELRLTPEAALAERAALEAFLRPAVDID
jgi:hypothetical protein